MLGTLQILYIIIIDFVAPYEMQHYNLSQYPFYLIFRCSTVLQKDGKLLLL
jgi:hypothetical protein